MGHPHFVRRQRGEHPPLLVAQKDVKGKDVAALPYPSRSLRNVYYVSTRRDRFANVIAWDLSRAPSTNHSTIRSSSCARRQGVSAPAHDAI